MMPKPQKGPNARPLFTVRGANEDNTGLPLPDKGEQADDKEKAAEEESAEAADE